MKKAASILLVLAMILTYVTAFAGDPWYCPDCGQKNESNFCSNCGAKRPDGSSGGSSSTGGMVFEKISANSDGSVVISWSGGQAPYKLQYDWCVSDNYNLGTDVTRWNAEENLYNTSVTLKYDLVPGERYWIIVTDANGNSVWEDYHPSPRFPAPIWFSPSGPNATNGRPRFKASLPMRLNGNTSAYRTVQQSR